MCDLCHSIVKEEMKKTFFFIWKHVWSKSIKGCDAVCVDILDWTTKMNVDQVG